MSPPPPTIRRHTSTSASEILKVTDMSMLRVYYNQTWTIVDDYWTGNEPSPWTVALTFIKLEQCDVCAKGEKLCEFKLMKKVLMAEKLILISQWRWWWWLMSVQNVAGVSFYDITFVVKNTTIKVGNLRKHLINILHGWSFGMFMTFVLLMKDENDKERDKACTQNSLNNLNQTELNFALVQYSL